MVASMFVSDCESFYNRVKALFGVSLVPVTLDVHTRVCVWLGRVEGCSWMRHKASQKPYQVRWRLVLRRSISQLQAAQKFAMPQCLCNLPPLHAGHSAPFVCLSLILRRYYFFMYQCRRSLPLRRFRPLMTHGDLDTCVSSLRILRALLVVRINSMRISWKCTGIRLEGLETLADGVYKRPYGT